MAVVTVAFEDLDTWLQEQPVNTASTPYELNITGLTALELQGSSNMGTLGFILRTNDFKYVDLSATILPSDISDLNATFQQCGTLVISPLIPNSVVEMSATFAGCSSLTVASIIPDNAEYMADTFYGCVSLSHKPIIPSTVVESTNCYAEVTTNNWKGTESQVTTFIGTLDATTDGFELQVYNNDRVTLEDTYSVVGIDNLGTYLASLPANTVDTPYKIKVTGLIANNCGASSVSGTLGYILINNNTKYVDLAKTVLPNNIVDMRLSFSDCVSLVASPSIPDSVTSMPGTFQRCSSLQTAPTIPSNVTNMGSCFFQCESIVEAPVLPSGVTALYFCFYLCISLIKAPIIPDTVTNMRETFTGCRSLTNPPIIPNGVTNMNMTFAQCRSLAYKPIIPNSVTDSTDCYNGVTQTRWGGSTSQIDTWVANQTTEFEVLEIEADTENNCYEPTGREVYGVDISNLDTWLSDADANTVDTPYEIKVLSITSSNLSDMTNALAHNVTKFVDLRYTVLPSVQSLNYLFNYCLNLIYSPTLPEGITSLVSAFGGCTNLKEAPTIPSTVTNLNYTFGECISLVNAPVIPNGVTKMQGTFSGCTSLINAPTIPNGVTIIQFLFSHCSSLVEPPIIPDNITNMFGVFEECSSLTSAPNIPNGVTDMTSCFRLCTSLTSAPTIPNSVTNINLVFEGCSAITEISLIPASVTSAEEAFKNCTSLRKINEFQIPLNTLKNNTNFQNMFQGCTSLTEIGYVIKESSWHVWRLKYGSNTVEGKVYFADGTSSNIPSTQITKSDLQMPIKTDELWFPTEQEEDIDELIGKMIQFKYGMYKKETIPPDEKTMVLWADNASHFKSNVPFVPVDEVTVGNMQSITSNAVAKALSYSTEEIDTGAVWIDGSKIYKQSYSFPSKSLVSNTNTKVGSLNGINTMDIINFDAVALFLHNGSKTCISYDYLGIYISKNDVYVSQTYTGSTITATILITVYYVKS